MELNILTLALVFHSICKDSFHSGKFWVLSFRPSENLWVMYVLLCESNDNEIHVPVWWKHVSKIQTVPCSRFAAFCAAPVEGKATNSEVNFVMFCSLGCLVSNDKSGFNPS